MFDHKTVERFELGWLAVGTVLIVLLFAGVLLSMVSDTVPAVWSGSGLTRVDPAKLADTPFATPGLREENGRLHAYVLARAFAFQPAELHVPVGRPVTLHFTAADVQHGLQIESSNINVQIIPGQVAAVTHTFRRAGTFVSSCNEYCGVSHHLMAFRLVVEDRR